VHAEHRRHVAGRREAIAGVHLADNDLPPDFRGHLIVDRHGSVTVQLDIQHSDIHSSTIMTIVDPKPVKCSGLPQAELLIREARRRQRRRWIVLGVLVVVLALVGVTIAGLSSGHVARSRGAAHPAAPRLGTSSGPINGTVPERPESLAVGPNGNVYLADDTLNQILERLPDGTFRVVAGDGTAGFSGDGGPAVRASLDYPAGIAFGPGGTLYIADLGNGRIRAVSTSGTITTVAGNGKQTGWVADGTPALGASLSPDAVAFGPREQMYVASQSEVLRLGAGDTFTRVLGTSGGGEIGTDGADEVIGPALDASAEGADGLAFDAAGNLYVSAFDSKRILMVNTRGTVFDLGPLYPHGFGGLLTAPDGTVLAIGELSVVRLSPQGIHTLIAFPYERGKTYLGITGFCPNGIAVAKDGSIYLDTGQNGFADKTALITVGPNGTPSLLWEQKGP
jgi:sugar lactone lactonase YvrE